MLHHMIFFILKLRSQLFAAMKNYTGNIITLNVSTGSDVHQQSNGGMMFFNNMKVVWWQINA